MSTMFLFATSAVGQSLSQKVTFTYTNEPLENIISDISHKYSVQFSYSRDFVPLDHRVSVSVKNQPLSTALNEVFHETPIEYAAIGDQVALRSDRRKNQQLTSIETLRGKVRQTSPIHPNPVTEVPAHKVKRNKEQEMPALDKKQTFSVSGGNRVIELEPVPYEMPVVPPVSVDEENRFAQISLLPFLGTNALRSNQITNNLSLNVFWGTNGGVDGLEVGGFFNSITKDVKGVQVAGFGNMVGGAMTGTQAAGLFNVSGESSQGVQAAGLFNVSGDFDGVQAAGLFNVSGGKAEGVQASGIFNVARGQVHGQASALFNKAGDVSWGQFSTLLNIGKRVKGFQIGLINISDTISGGAPIGLLNIVRDGYNRTEFSASESLYANFGLKLGARSFYNVFHFGVRWDDASVSTDSNLVQSGTFTTWGLGYGFGSAVGLSKRTLLNFEIVGIHLNEWEEWTNKLNLLGQLRLTLDIRPGRNASLFFGPVGNILISKRINPETGVIGSSIAPYALYDETRGDTNIKAWVGFQAGVRF
ncbi:MAG: secretin and TonB N-terminal domain-containing protein [Saprospiraceae bacterium]|nr:secretin and TonB N-terminal domain-containing protein [Saprospiraceae bacterium]